MRYLLFAILAFGTTSLASAQAPVPAAAPVEAPATTPVSAPVPDSAKSTKASSDTVSEADQAIRCRKVEVTGSLVKKGRVCKTLAQWRQITESNNDLARRMVEDGTTRPSGQ